MMKKLFALLTALILTFSFATTCFAAVSPGPTVISPEPTTEKPGPAKSPQTGLPIAGAFVAVITSAGLALVAKKEME